MQQLGKILRPELLADRLDHLDGGDPVIAVALVAIVLQSDLDAIIEPCVLNTLLCEVALLGADRETDDLGAKGLGDVFGEASPSTSDLQQRLSRLQVDGFGEPAVFVVLGGGK